MDTKHTTDTKMTDSSSSSSSTSSSSAAAPAALDFSPPQRDPEDLDDDTQERLRVAKVRPSVASDIKAALEAESDNEDLQAAAENSDNEADFDDVVLGTKKVGSMEKKKRKGKNGGDSPSKKRKTVAVKLTKEEKAADLSRRKFNSALTKVASTMCTTPHHPLLAEYLTYHRVMAELTAKHLDKYEKELPELIGAQISLEESKDANALELNAVIIAECEHHISVCRKLKATAMKVLRQAVPVVSSVLRWLFKQSDEVLQNAIRAAATHGVCFDMKELDDPKKQKSESRYKALWRTLKLGSGSVADAKRAIQYIRHILAKFALFLLDKFGNRVIVLELDETGEHLLRLRDTTRHMVDSSKDVEMYELVTKELIRVLNRLVQYNRADLMELRRKPYDALYSAFTLFQARAAKMITPRDNIAACMTLHHRYGVVRGALMRCFAAPVPVRRAMRMVKDTDWRPLLGLSCARTWISSKGQTKDAYLLLVDIIVQYASPFPFTASEFMPVVPAARVPGLANLCALPAPTRAASSSVLKLDEKEAMDLAVDMLARFSNAEQKYKALDEKSKDDREDDTGVTRDPSNPSELVEFNRTDRIVAYARRIAPGEAFDMSHRNPCAPREPVQVRHSGGIDAYVLGDAKSAEFLKNQLIFLSNEQVGLMRRIPDAITQRDAIDRWLLFDRIFGKGSSSAAAGTASGKDSDSELKDEHDVDIEAEVENDDGAEEDEENDPDYNPEEDSGDEDVYTDVKDPEMDSSASPSSSSSSVSSSSSSSSSSSAGGPTCSRYITEDNLTRRKHAREQLEAKISEFDSLESKEMEPSGIYSEEFARRFIRPYVPFAANLLDGLVYGGHILDGRYVSVRLVNRRNFSRRQDLLQGPVDPSVEIGRALDGIAVVKDSLARAKAVKRRGTKKADAEEYQSDEEDLAIAKANAGEDDEE